LQRRTNSKLIATITFSAVFDAHHLSALVTAEDGADLDGHIVVGQRVERESAASCSLGIAPTPGVTARLRHVRGHRWRFVIHTVVVHGEAVAIATQLSPVALARHIAVRLARLVGRCVEYIATVTFASVFCAEKIVG
jgi:hypothetical protein